MFPIINIKSTKEEILTIFPEGPSEKKTDDRKGLEQWVFTNQYGRYLVAFIDDAAHSIIFQIESATEEARKEKYYFMLGKFQEGSKWKFLADNGSGYLFEREDKQLFASWSYLMDIWSFHTPEYRASASKKP